MPVRYGQHCRESLGNLAELLQSIQPFIIPDAGQHLVNAFERMIDDGLPDLFLRLEVVINRAFCQPAQFIDDILNGGLLVSFCMNRLRATVRIWLMVSSGYLFLAIRPLLSYIRLVCNKYIQSSV